MDYVLMEYVFTKKETDLRRRHMINDKCHLEA